MMENDEDMVEDSDYDSEDLSNNGNDKEYKIRPHKHIRSVGVYDDETDGDSPEF
jgi:hypothetical protein